MKKHINIDEIEARIDELNRASYVVAKTLAEDIDQEYDYSDIQNIFENYQKLRAIQLRTTK